MFFVFSLVGLIGGIIGAFSSVFSWNYKRKQDKKYDERQKEQDIIAEETREINEKFQDFQKSFSIYQQRTNELQFQLENRSSLIPYFHLNRTKSRTYYGENNQLIIEVHLTNVGRGTATSILACPLKDETTGEAIIFKQDNLMAEVNYSWYDYFNENYAMPKESIFFSIVAIRSNNLEEDDKIDSKINFKIEFNDTLGRKYEQKFSFRYDNHEVNGLHILSDSFIPKLVNDIDK